MTHIAFRANASLKGKALAQTAVTLDQNTIDYCSDVPATLPVALSSFTAAVTTETFVQLEWTAETETNMLGYNVYRAEENKLADAVAVNGVVIPAKNSSVATSYNYTDESVVPGSTYYYWLQSVDLDLTYEFHGPTSVMVEDDGEGGGVLPDEVVTKLIGAYPNPFNPGTSINFSLKEATEVTITIYNAKGQLVSPLVDNQLFDKDNSHSVYWDGKDYRGNDVASGIYLYIMQTGDYYHSKKKMLLVK